MKTYLFLIAILIFGSFVFCESDDDSTGSETKYTMNLYNNKNCEGTKNGSYQFQHKVRKRAKDDNLYEIEVGSGSEFQFRRCESEDTEECEDVTTFELGECKPITDLDDETLNMLFSDEVDGWGDTESFEFSGSYIAHFSLIILSFSMNLSKEISKIVNNYIQSKQNKKDCSQLLESLYIYDSSKSFDEALIKVVADLELKNFSLKLISLFNYFSNTIPPFSHSLLATLFNLLVNETICKKQIIFLYFCRALLSSNQFLQVLPPELILYLRECVFGIIGEGTITKRVLTIQLLDRLYLKESEYSNNFLNFYDQFETGYQKEYHLLIGYIGKEKSIKIQQQCLINLGKYARYFDEQFTERIISCLGHKSKKIANTSFCLLKENFSHFQCAFQSNITLLNSLSEFQILNISTIWLSQLDNNLIELSKNLFWLDNLQTTKKILVTVLQKQNEPLVFPVRIILNNSNNLKPHQVFVWKLFLYHCYRNDLVDLFNLSTIGISCYFNLLKNSINRLSSFRNCKSKEYIHTAFIIKQLIKIGTLCFVNQPYLLKRSIKERNRKKKKEKEKEKVKRKRKRKKKKNLINKKKKKKKKKKTKNKNKNKNKNQNKNKNKNKKKKTSIDKETQKYNQDSKKPYDLKKFYDSVIHLIITSKTESLDLILWCIESLPRLSLEFKIQFFSDIDTKIEKIEQLLEEDQNLFSQMKQIETNFKKKNTKKSNLFEAQKQLINALETNNKLKWCFQKQTGLTINNNNDTKGGDHCNNDSEYVDDDYSSTENNFQNFEKFKNNNKKIENMYNFILNLQENWQMILKKRVFIWKKCLLFLIVILNLLPQTGTHAKPNKKHLGNASRQRSIDKYRKQLLDQNLELFDWIKEKIFKNLQSQIQLSNILQPYLLKVKCFFINGTSLQIFDNFSFFQNQLRKFIQQYQMKVIAKGTDLTHTNKKDEDKELMLGRCKSKEKCETKGNSKKKNTHLKLDLKSGPESETYAYNEIEMIQLLSKTLLSLIVYRIKNQKKTDLDRLNKDKSRLIKYFLSFLKFNNIQIKFTGLVSLINLFYCYEIGIKNRNLILEKFLKLLYNNLEKNDLAQCVLYNELNLFFNDYLNSSYQNRKSIIFFSTQLLFARSSSATYTPQNINNLILFTNYIWEKIDCKKIDNNNNKKKIKNKNTKKNKVKNNNNRRNNTKQTNTNHTLQINQFRFNFYTEILDKCFLDQNSNQTLILLKVLSNLSLKPIINPNSQIVNTLITITTSISDQIQSNEIMKKNNIKYWKKNLKIITLFCQSNTLKKMQISKKKMKKNPNKKIMKKNFLIFQQNLHNDLHLLTSPNTQKKSQNDLIIYEDIPWFPFTDDSFSDSSDDDFCHRIKPYNKPRMNNNKQKSKEKKN
ncbi:myb-like protein x [Anaeramoeba flamelloides]|uniref:Myb-like protein x n=1 Tax=Anaeramoeba flamelloides TaxID=1746091 RepID=A0ABQ8YY79_9EUKA|nr:myb-like protein x [Anaeramoeba flamelloides]